MFFVSLPQLMIGKHIARQFHRVEQMSAKDKTKGPDGRVSLVVSVSRHCDLNPAVARMFGGECATFLAVWATTTRPGLPESSQLLLQSGYLSQIIKTHLNRAIHAQRNPIGLGPDLGRASQLAIQHLHI